MGRITAIARLPTPVTHLTAPTAAATLHLTATATPDLTAPTAAATLHLTATTTPHRTVITDHPATTGGLSGFSTEGAHRSDDRRTGPLCEAGGLLMQFCALSDLRFGIRFGRLGV